MDEGAVSLRAAELCRSGLELEQVFLGLCSLLAERMDASIVMLVLRHRDGARVRLYARFGELIEPDNPLLPADSVTAQVLHSAKPRLFVSDDDWIGRASFNFGGEGTPTRSAIFVPIVQANETIAVFSVQSFVSAAYRHTDIATVEACAAGLAACLS